MLVDSHCHLNYPDFKQDLDQVIKNAHDQGISHMLTVNTRLSESLDIQRIAEANANIFVLGGLNPSKTQLAVDFVLGAVSVIVFDPHRHIQRVVKQGEGLIDASWCD